MICFLIGEGKLGTYLTTKKQNCLLLLLLLLLIIFDCTHSGKV